MRAFAILALAALCLGPIWAGPTAARPLDSARCAALGTISIPPAAIALPTSGAHTTAATLVPADAAKGRPEHCLVAGAVAPADRTAPDIQFHVALPLDWNGKVVMFGGGGLDGVVPDVAGGPQAAESARTPLARGYAVFGSDGGHQTPGASFALNQEAWRNYLGDALKKTRDASLAVIARAYGAAPSRAYFLGGSKGGAEGLAVAARWPKDWDGVVSLYPARNPMVAVFGLLSLNQALATPGGFPSLEQRALVFQAALARCDALDGLKDGVISDVQGCRKVFDPATASLHGAPIRCADRADASAPCLTDAQLATFKAIDSPRPLPFPIGGETEFLGYNAYTSDTGAPGASLPRATATVLAFGFVPPASPYRQGMTISFSLVDPFVREVLLQSPNGDALKFELGAAGELADRYRAYAVGGDADLDLSGFARRGGKLLLLQGTDDLLITPRATEAYYERVRGRLGAAAADRTIRFYEVPGFGHSTSAVFGMNWDQLGALERWVQQGTDPAERETVTDTTGVPGRTRPLCLYPAWPKYRGAGDANSAASFTCAGRRP